MRPPWPHLAHRSLVWGVPGWPRCGLVWPRQEWPGVAEPLIQLHSVAFRCIPIVRTLTLTLSLTLSQRERGSYRGTGLRGSRLRGNEGGLLDDDVCEQCSSQRGYGVMGSCRWFGVWCALSNRRVSVPSPWVAAACVCAYCAPIPRYRVANFLEVEPLSRMDEGLYALLSVQHGDTMLWREPSTMRQEGSQCSRCSPSSGYSFFSQLVVNRSRPNRNRHGRLSQPGLHNQHGRLRRRRRLSPFPQTRRTALQRVTSLLQHPARCLRPVQLPP